ncbi:DUF2339 domain-containing protein [Sphingobacterium hungaricum]|uniref:DUF2339 domain-containing protein n=1 Tax=Sphingobacterium hungaricum TaxID=2082723 RepID=A0A928YTC6_9SPHI|nr:DUF2339 domain-containing protein [Sphingobacterium hungaricum]MBE8715048.1 DUF2339 domain-containing protein [Sphingobacterium hungaricum]
MDILIIIGVVAIIFLLTTQRSTITHLQNSIFDVQAYIRNLQKEVESLKKQLSQKAAEKPAEELKPKEIIKEVPLPTPEEKIEPAKSKEIVLGFEDLPTENPKEEKPVVQATQSIPAAVPQRNLQKPVKPFIPEPERISWFTKFKQDNPDVEKFIGENLINKIGILILVLGIGYFVKYAIDRDWINEPARVGIGLLCGGILLTLAHRLRTKFQAFSSVFVAGGIAVFYLTIGIAFHDYQLFSQTTAFIIMICITAFSAFVSIAYNRQELAVLALIGGFGVPFMVSTGEGNYHVLLSYLAILNVGMLIISYYKRWNWVNFTAFVCTLFIYAGWFFSADFSDAVVARNAFLYSTVFYIIFSIAFALNNTVEKTKFSTYEIIAILVNTCFYFGFSTYAFEYFAPNSKGLFAIGLGAYNLVYAGILYKKYRFDYTIVYVLIGIALTMATLTIPIQFSGNYITMFWACEAYLLFWLSSKSNMRGFTIAGVIVQVLSIISLSMDWLSYGNNDMLFFNGLFLTGLLVIGSLVGSYKLFKVYNFSFSFYELNFDGILYRKIALATALVLGYIVPILDLINYFEYSQFLNTYLYAFHMLYTTAIVFYGIQSIEVNRNLAYYLAFFNCAFYALFGSSIIISEIYYQLYDEVYAFPTGFFVHLMSVTCLIYQAWILVRDTQSSLTPKFFTKKSMVWALSFLVVFLLSKEIYIAIQSFADSTEQYYDTKSVYLKVILPILWGILSFGFLSYGVRQNSKIIRIVALVLLGVTILKLFIYDIQDASETGKIIAFILLGIVILIISFVYQKIKKLVIDNPSPKDEKDN